MKTVDLSERVTATYYDDEHEEWSQKTVAIFDVLDSVCDDYTVIEAEPVKHGRWLPSDKGDCTYTCSECGFVRDAYILEEKAYCPRCGADMRERGEDG